MKDKIDWQRIKSMTEEEIVAAANADPDAPLLTPAELKNFKRIHPNEGMGAIPKNPNSNGT